MSEPARSIEAAQAEIIGELAALQDPIACYQYLIAQGNALPEADRDLRTDQHAIPGCQVNVWVRAQVVDGRMRLSGDSDARINRGMVALLLRALDGQPPGDVLAADLFFLDRTRLRIYLSPARANGLAALVQRVRSCAEAFASPPG